MPIALSELTCSELDGERVTSSFNEWHETSTREMHRLGTGGGEVRLRSFFEAEHQTGVPFIVFGVALNVLKPLLGTLLSLCHVLLLSQYLRRMRSIQHLQHHRLNTKEVLRDTRAAHHGLVIVGSQHG